MRPIEPLNIEDDIFQGTFKPFILKRRKGDWYAVVEKIINYHFKGAKANEMKSRFTIEFLPDSNFNTLLRYYNEFVLSTLKRIDGNYDLEYIRTLCKLMDAPKPKTTLDLNIINEVKDKALDSLLYHICLDNGMLNSQKQSLKYDYQRKTSFKAFVCKANNGHIVKTILK